MTTYLITSNHQECDDIDTVSVQPLHIGNKKTVVFEPYAKVWIVELYPQELHEDLWYSSQEYQDIKRNNAHEIKEAQIFGASASNIFQQSEYRGLERSLDENRKLIVFRSIQVVLMEQDRLQIEQEQDVEALSNVYQCYCVSSVEKAQRLANLDKRDAQQAMHSNWMQPGVDADVSEQCTESDCSDSSVVSDSDSLQACQQRRRRRRIFLRQQKRRSDMKNKTSVKEKVVDESILSPPHRLWMNMMAPMIPSCG
jgi:hypothetical protein